MSKHTPGPWIAKDATLPNRAVTRWVILEPENGFTLADTGNADTDKKQDAANARLIAAAPDLLEALRSLTYQCLNPNFDNEEVWRKKIRAAEKAIAKAEDDPRAIAKAEDDPSEK